MKTLTNYYNPIINLEKTFQSLFDHTPLFHNLEEIYRTGDQVRFSNDDKGLTVQVDLPGVAKDKLKLSTDSDKREVYIKATRTVKTQEGQREQTYNRSFSVGREYDLNKINFEYVDGQLEVLVPLRKKEEYIRTYSV
jgi:HSP20 family molecular chaperone IbpA